MDTCKVVRLENGRLVPVLPTGETIPGIEKGSIKYFQDEDFKGAGLTRVQVILLVKDKDIEGGYPVTQEEEEEENKEPVSKGSKIKRFIGWTLVAAVWGAAIYNFVFLVPFTVTLMMFGSFLIFAVVSLFVIWLFK